MLMSAPSSPSLSAVRTVPGDPDFERDYLRRSGFFKSPKQKQVASHPGTPSRVNRGRARLASKELSPAADALDQFASVVGLDSAS
ncbi:hypothetical protein MTX26_01735 [Bradyrhizobium sp. ISRA443]|uniref:hypothetical protein n=1 Tax=unclassified Bradyrhizobium TaxID=2631580 RepID=UPI00247AE013|nr:MULTISPECIES: hypothetical protein [unclassified Bradyrhizobium]WGR94791.1 hypothetical protein MTX20_11775 [Bradyrhizobium sp. ISRA435]WGR99620.1 hypothetical protein MTX23_01735 [Bradyrhizobium sp. ISRA436]WGS06510.1 hypothetical protein MTX18_01735 [Bradyrhizobium sp. ISRA437]WGS13394.1 hypothetical protein MTX26_01735 [Bradyrhizobium sp. ISRA443]